jgi:hypothetical protein
METVICDRCGSGYKVIVHRSSFKEGDSVKCEVCDNVPDEWKSSTTYYEYVLIKEGSNIK